MKLLMAIIRDDFAPDVNAALTEQGFSVTRISSTGGFWRRGYVTLIIGVDEPQIEEALKLIDANAGPELDPSLAPPEHPPRRATVFVMDVARFARY